VNRCRIQRWPCHRLRVSIWPEFHRTCPGSGRVAEAPFEKHAGLSALSLLVMLVNGCGGDPNRGSANGRVTFDGKPLAEGRIVFYPAGDTTGPATGAAIVDGYYSIQRDRGPAVGRNRVEINARLRTGAPQPLPPREQRKGRLTSEDMYRSWGVRPLEFESEVPLQVEIKAGRNVHDFPLRPVGTK